MTDVLITGLPRSGLTAVSALIDGLPDSVGLNAPAEQFKTGRQMQDAGVFSKYLIGDIVWQRLQLSRQEPVSDFRAKDGAPLLDHLKDPSAVRDAEDKLAPVPFTRTGLSPGFMLGVKHHALYTSVLPQLLAFDHFTVIAVIRHPLDVILSWQSLKDRPIAKGQIPIAEHYWPEAWSVSSNEKIEALDRMVQLYDIFCERYHQLRDKIHIIKYEDVIAEPMSISRLLGIDKLSANASRIQPPRHLRSREQADEILSRLKKSSVFAKKFYILE